MQVLCVSAALFPCVFPVSPVYAACYSVFCLFSLFLRVPSPSHLQPLCFSPHPFRRIRREKWCDQIKLFIFGGCLAVASPVHLLSRSFAPKQVKLIHNHVCFLTGQNNILEVKLTWCYTVMIKCIYMLSVQMGLNLAFSGFMQRYFFLFCFYHTEITVLFIHIHYCHISFACNDCLKAATHCEVFCRQSLICWTDVWGFFS